MLQMSIGLPADKAYYNCLILVQLIGGKFARMRAANGGEFASGCTRHHGPYECHAQACFMACVMTDIAPKFWSRLASRPAGKTNKARRGGESFAWPLPLAPHRRRRNLGLAGGRIPFP